MVGSNSIKRVVVTGGSGRVGRYVLRELAAGYDVINADLKEHNETSFAKTDVMDLGSVRAALEGADAVIHLAALDYDWGAPPEDYMRVNTLGTWHVLQAAAEHGLRKAVVCSSVSAAGLTEMRPDWLPQYLPVNEEHECRPVHAYGVSKLAVEASALSFARGTQMDVLCIRPVAVVLRETFDGYLRFIDEPGRRWLFYYVTAEDLARGFRRALELEGLRYGVFLLSAADSSLEQPTLEWYAERVGRLPELANPRQFARNKRASVFSASKARDVLGWEASSDFLALRREWPTPEGSRHD
jgi:UDP-glucose 4-epimerase